MELLCKVQTYDWGSRDPENYVHQLSLKNDPGKTAESVTGGLLDRPHAEIWMGTHVNGPSVIKSSGKLLSRNFPFIFSPNNDLLKFLYFILISKQYFART